VAILFSISRTFDAGMIVCFSLDHFVTCVDIILHSIEGLLGFQVRIT
jgi:hypothetical protein